MSRRRAAVASAFLTLAALVLAVLPLAALTLTACAEAPRRAEAPPPEPAPGEPSPLFTGGANRMEVTLFFVHPDGEELAMERREIFRTATANDRARQTLQALFAGPQSGLLPAVPRGTVLRELFLTSEGTAYADLSSEFREGMTQGSSDAVFAVYAVVNTLAENFHEIDKVKILVEGEEPGDVAGHLALSRPILPEMSFVHGGEFAPEPAGPPPAGGVGEIVAVPRAGPASPPEPDRAGPPPEGL